jgi:hypothetical protein
MVTRTRRNVTLYVQYLPCLKKIHEKTEVMIHVLKDLSSVYRKVTYSKRELCGHVFPFIDSTQI